MNIGSLFFTLLADGAQLQASIEKEGTTAADKASGKVGKRFSDGLTKGMTAAGAIGGALFTGAVGGAANFEDQLRTINTVAHLTDDQLKATGQSILDLSKETGKSTDDLTAGFYDLVSAGVPADKAIGVLKDSAILATGALGTTAETVDLVTSALNAYGLDAKESTKITDIFAQAVADGKVTASELGSSLANIAPIASSAGISLEEVSAGYAVLTAKGVPAAQAATQMRAAISALLTPNEQLNDIQRETGKNFAQLAKTKGLAKALEELRQATGGNAEAFAKALGSVEAYQFAVQTTGDNAASFATELDKVTVASEKGGVAQGQYEERMKSAKMQAEKFVAGLRATALEVGGPFVDSLGAGVLALNELGGGMGGLVNLSRLFGGVVGGTAGFLGSKLGPKIKAGLLAAVAKVVLPGNLFSKALSSGLETGIETGMTAGIEKATKSAATKGALMRGISALAAIAPPILIGLALAPVAQQVKDDAKSRAEQLAREAQNSGDQAKIDQAIKNLEALKRASHYTGDQATMAFVDAQIAGLQNGGKGVDMAAHAAAESSGRAASDGFATGLESGTQVVGNAAATVASAAGVQFGRLPAEAKATGAATTRAYADGVQAKRDVVSSVIAALREAIKNEMSPAKERARVIGELTSKELAKGLKSKDPVVRQAAQDAKNTLLTRLSELTGETGKLGKKTGELLAQGLKSKDPDIRAAAKKVKETIEAKLRETDGKKLGKTIGEGINDGLDSKKGKIGSTARSIGKKIGRDLVTGITIYIGKQVPKDNRAVGGPVAAGESYLVGERGPELFTPNVGGKIATASKTAATLGEMAAAASGGTTINLQTYGLPMRAETPAEVVHRIRRATRLGIVAPPRRAPAWSTN